jgi:hypothetical protein
MLTKHTSPFLTFHTIATARGDGLRPEFLDLFRRLAASADATLSESAPSPVECGVEQTESKPATTARLPKSR